MININEVIEKDDADEMFDDVAESEKDDQKGESDELSLRVQNKKKLANAYGRDPRRAIDRAAKSVRERASRFTGSSYFIRSHLKDPISIFIPSRLCSSSLHIYLLWMRNCSIIVFGK